MKRSLVDALEARAIRNALDTDGPSGSARDGEVMAVARYVDTKWKRHTWRVTFELNGRRISRALLLNRSEP